MSTEMVLTTRHKRSSNWNTVWNHAKLVRVLTRKQEWARVETCRNWKSAALFVGVKMVLLLGKILQGLFELWFYYWDLQNSWKLCLTGKWCMDFKYCCMKIKIVFNSIFHKLQVPFYIQKNSNQDLELIFVYLCSW